MNQTRPDMGGKRERVLPIALIVAFAWLVLLTGDWWMRFHWFRWHESLIVRPADPHSESLVPLREERIPARRGGDLTRLIGIPAIAERYEVERPAVVILQDEFGYRNVPPTAGKDFPIVVVGDSYMEDGITMEDTFPSRLAEVSGMPVYSHALPGWGSFISIVRFLESIRFRERPPRFLMLGVIEREISGGYFEGLVYQLYAMEHGVDASSGGPSWNLFSFAPAQLRKSLPNSSIMAQFSSRAWNRLRYVLLGRLNPFIIPLPEPVGGEAMLFYYPSIDAMGWGPDIRAPAKVADCLQYLNRICLERGIKLVIVLIPDKEQVYRAHIPKAWNRRDRPLPPSCLRDLEAALRERDIGVVNLLGPFLARASAGDLLYWPDDTHWNPAGIRLAAETTWDMIRHLDGVTSSAGQRPNR